MVVDRSLAEIAKTAQNFRLAIEKTDRSSLPITFSKFPRGNCGDAALLLGTYFHENGLGMFNYVIGERGRGSEQHWTSHAWIERDGLIVDITADQFADAPSAVIVTRDTSWHQLFESEVRNNACIDEYDAYTAGTLRIALECVVKNIGTAN